MIFSIMQVPFLDFHYSPKEEEDIMAAINRVIKSRWFILGREVEQLEALYAQFNAVKYCVGVSNGLDALHLALRALEVGAGDEVIVPSNTYIASVLAITHVGAMPVFVEPRMGTYNINPDLIEEKISNKTKVIIPVHLYGHACEMDSIMHIAEKNNLHLVEDNAQAHGAMFNGKLTGSFGDINATSFYPTKNLGALGDAGALTTDSENLFLKVRQYRNYGSNRKYFNEVIGYNARLDELQAAILNVKLIHLNAANEERKIIASLYREGLKNIGEVQLPQIAEKATSVYHQFVIRTKRRDELLAFLHAKGIQTMIHYPVPPHLQRAYAYLGYRKGDLPIAEEIADTVLSLPIYPGLKQAQVEYVCEMIQCYFRN